MASSRYSIAIHTLCLLARADEKPLKSEQIACLVKTNPVVIRRILSELGRAGQVVSQAGAAGGTRLARKPEEILLVEIYRVIESREIFALHRKKPDERCEIGLSIEVVLLQIQNKLDRAIEDGLGKITLADVLEMIEDENRRCRGRMREINENV
ncbi:MAG: Rrf2 family transcriptional regulator [Acidobacteriota bacterium]|nr:Rrf2 family transcriptional regulator [Acidobacteriota bacterium]